MLEVIIMQGVSGSGKSTFIKNNFPSAIVVSADYYFVNVVTGNYEFKSELLGEAHANCLRSYIDTIIAWNTQVEDGVLVVDNTNCTVAEIAPYAAIATAYGRKLKIICLDIDPKVAAARNLHGVDESNVMVMAERIQNSAKELPLYWPREVICQQEQLSC